MADFATWDKTQNTQKGIRPYNRKNAVKNCTLKTTTCYQHKCLKIQNPNFNIEHLGNISLSLMHHTENHRELTNYPETENKIMHQIS